MAFRIPLFFLALTVTFTVHGADLQPLRETAEQHIRLQTQGLPGKATISIGQVDVSRLPPCNVHEAFTPQGSRAIGKTTVGVRCLSPSSWSVLLPAQIAVTGNYVTTNRPLVAGQVIQASDLVTLHGDVSALPTGVIGDPAQAVGKTVRNSVGSGQPLRAEQLLAPLVIRQGQTVRVISKGEGFAASAEGRAVASASEGQVVQVRMNSGQTVSGIAQKDGSVEIVF